jgi:phosphonate transport system substrate-binding protein
MPMPPHHSTGARRQFMRLGFTASIAAAATVFPGLRSALAQTPPSAPQSAPPSAPPLVLGVLPNISARVLLTHYQPMREYLEQSLGRPVQVVTASDFRAFAQATREGQYDVVVTAPNLGRMAQKDSNWVPLAQYEPGIPALLVGTTSQPQATVLQLKGKALALGNPQSLVALVGLRWLSEQGLAPERDFQIIRTPNDDSLGAVLRSGEAPFAIMSMGEFRAKPDALRQTLRIVTQIATVPGFLVMANPATERGKLTEALAAFPGSEAGRKFFALSGFTHVRRPEESELATLDPYVQATRRALFGEN